MLGFGSVSFGDDPHAGPSGVIQVEQQLGAVKASASTETTKRAESRLTDKRSKLVEEIEGAIGPEPEKLYISNNGKSPAEQIESFINGVGLAHTEAGEGTEFRHKINTLFVASSR